MMNRWIGCFLGLLLAASAPLALSAPQVYGPYRATVLRVVDGDTVEVGLDVYPGIVRIVKIRLAGINAPETRTRDSCEKAAGLLAKEEMQRLMSRPGPVEVVDLHEGKFAGRAVARILVDGVDVGQVMLQKGLVRPYSGGRRGPWCL